MRFSFIHALVPSLCFGLAPAFHGQSRPVRPSTDGLSCSTFKWSADANSPRAAIRVPISLNGHPYWYQLDTGADVVIAYGNGEHDDWTTKKEYAAVRNVRFAGMSIPVFPVFRMKNTPISEEIQGTVGLDLLVGHAFVIDFPKQRVCLLNRADLPDSLNEAASWTGAEIHRGKLFVDGLSLNGKALPGVIYDSGTSPDELALDLQQWQQATGKLGVADDSIHKFAATWGERVEYIEAKATGALAIGDLIYPHPTLTSTPARPTQFHDDVNGVSGALGNALFFNSIVILDLGSHPEFGVIPAPVVAK